MRRIIVASITRTTGDGRQWGSVAITVMQWVWNHSQSRHAARLVLLALADRAREDGSAWPSNPELRRMTGLGERAVQTAVIQLAKLGELEVGYQQGPKGCNRYRVLMTPADSAPPQTLRGSADNAPPQDSRGSDASQQASGQNPANFAPPAESAPPQNSTRDPAESADGTVIEPPLNSPTESSQGGAGGGALFGGSAAKPKRARRKPPAAGADFERWYAAYPVHKARGDAEKAWAQVLADGADPAALTAAAERYRTDPQVIRGYGKYPAGWLRAKCWLDEPGTDSGTNRPAPPNGHQSTGAQRAQQAINAGEELQRMIDEGRYPG